MISVNEGEVVNMRDLRQGSNTYYFMLGSRNDRSTHEGELGLNTTLYKYNGVDPNNPRAVIFSEINNPSHQTTFIWDERPFTVYLHNYSGGRKRRRAKSVKKSRSRRLRSSRSRRLRKTHSRRLRRRH